MLVIEKMSFKYRKSKKLLFDDLSLNIEKGRIYGLLGKNGVGKSTLLYLMTGLLFPQKGKIFFEGKNVETRSPEVLKEVFLVPEEFELPQMKLLEFEKTYSPFYPKFNPTEFETYLRDMELEKNVNLSKLSMGQKKKVLLCFALATNTQLIIMDEPTNGLDIPSKSQFRKIIASSMQDDRTIIISTHQVRDLDKLIDSVIILDNNHMILNEQLEQITEKLFFIETNDSHQLDDAIYRCDNITGYSGILINDENTESEPNIEHLFNCAIENPEKIKALFNTTHSAH